MLRPFFAHIKSKNNKCEQWYFHSFKWEREWANGREKKKVVQNKFTRDHIGQIVEAFATFAHPPSNHISCCKKKSLGTYTVKGLTNNRWITKNIKRMLKYIRNWISVAVGRFFCFFFSFCVSFPCGWNKVKCEWGSRRNSISLNINVTYCFIFRISFPFFSFFHFVNVSNSLFSSDSHKKLSSTLIYVKRASLCICSRLCWTSLL